MVSIAARGSIAVLEDEAAGARNPSAIAVWGCGDIDVTNAAFLFSDSVTLQWIER